MLYCTRNVHSQAPMAGATGSTIAAGDNSIPKRDAQALKSPAVISGKASENPNLVRAAEVTS